MILELFSLQYRRLTVLVHAAALVLLILVWGDLPLLLQLAAVVLLAWSLADEWRKSSCLLRIDDTGLALRRTQHHPWQDVQLQAVADFAGAACLCLRLPDGTVCRHLLLSDTTGRAEWRSLHLRMRSLQQAQRES